MRPDVKLGVFISMVVVLVAGGYYLYRDKGERTIPVSSAEPASRAVQPATGASSPAGVSPDSVNGKPQTVPVETQDAGALAATREGDTSGGPRGPRSEAVAKGASREPEKIRPAADRSDVGTPEAGKPKKVAAKREGQPGPEVEPDRSGPPVQTRVATRGPVRPDESRTASREPAERKDPVAARRVPLTAANSDPGVRRATPKAVAEVAVDTHRVQLGDTLSSIAQAYYGSAKYAGFLMAKNPQIGDAKRLEIGSIVRIPLRPPGDTWGGASPRVAEKTHGDPVTEGGRTYRVKPGDSFYAIARDVLGDASRWKELFELNKHLVGGDPTRLQVDQVVALPTR